jgi:hypothetical protein
MSKLTGMEMNPTKTCKRGDFTKKFHQQRCGSNPGSHQQLKCNYSNQKTITSASNEWKNGIEVVSKTHW